MSLPGSNIATSHRIWLFYDRDGEFVTHDRFATSVEAEAFATERNLLPWMPPISAVGWGDVIEDDRANLAANPDAVWPSP
jgi:hypothetical protein